jgi:DNA polymerase-3 subunit alpha (Gram-positive type)
MPFITIDGLGLKVAESIVTAREEQPYKSKDDLKERSSITKTSIKKLEMLDVLDDLPDNSQLNLFSML